MNRQLDDATMDHLRHSHEWVRWLSDADAKVVLMALCDSVERSKTLAAVQEDVTQWRTNALEALTADNWTASIDDYLEVCVDARQYLLTQRKI